MGNGRDYDFSAFKALLYKPQQLAWGQTGGQIFALCFAHRNRKSPLGKNPNIKTPSFPLCNNQSVIFKHFGSAIPSPSPICWGGGSGYKFLHYMWNQSRKEWTTPLFLAVSLFVSLSVCLCLSVCLSLSLSLSQGVFSHNMVL